MLGCLCQRLGIAQVLQHLERRLAKESPSLSLAMLSIVGKVEQTDAIRTACIGQMRRCFEMLRRRPPKRKHIVALRHLVALPQRVAQLKVERRSNRLLPNRR